MGLKLPQSNLKQKKILSLDPVWPGTIFALPTSQHVDYSVSATVDQVWSFKKNPVFQGKGHPEDEKLEIFLIFKHCQWWHQMKALRKVSLKKYIFF